MVSERGHMQADGFTASQWGVSASTAQTGNKACCGMHMGATSCTVLVMVKYVLPEGLAVDTAPMP